MLIIGARAVTGICSTSDPASGTGPEASGRAGVSAVPAAAAPVAIGQRVQQAAVPPGGDDWSSDPDTIGIRYNSLTALEAEVEQPECTAAMGTDSGPPALNGLSINIPILSCKDRRQCNGEWHLRCKVFGIFCLTRKSKGGCDNHAPQDCQVTAPNGY